LLIVNKRETTATEAVERLRGMFLDVPGTRLSVADAARLSGVEPSLCRRGLETLLETCFLKRGQMGRSRSDKPRSSTVLADALGRVMSKGLAGLDPKAATLNGTRRRSSKLRAS
jgi:hypothetical protein